MTTMNLKLQLQRIRLLNGSFKVLLLLLPFCFFLPFHAQAAETLLAKFISVTALTLRNSQPHLDPTTKIVRGVRVCNVGDTDASNVRATWNWVDSTDDCNPDLILLENSPNYLEIASLEACGSVCDNDDFWDAHDVEDLAGYDPHDIPDYCHDFYFTLNLDTYYPDPADTTKATTFLGQNNASTCSTYCSHTLCDTAQDAAESDFQIQISSGDHTTPGTTTTTYYDMETDANGDGYNHLMKGFQGTTPGSLAVEIASIYDRDRDVTYTGETATFFQGNYYDVRLCGTSTDGQIQIDLGVNFPAADFELISFKTIWDPKEKVDPKTGVTVPFRNNTAYMTFCDFVQDKNDTTEYGTCRDAAGSDVVGIYLNDAADQALKTNSENLASCGIEVMVRLKALAESSTGSSLTPYIMANAAGTSAQWKKDVGVSWNLFPTYASIGNFNVEEINGEAVVQWSTDVEVGTIGFHVLRKEQGVKGYTQLNKELLLADPNAKAGADYSFVDQSAQVGESYLYKIVEVDFRGTKNSYGPFPVTVSTGTVSEPVLQNSSLSKRSSKIKASRKSALHADSKTKKISNNGFQRKTHRLGKKLKDLNRTAQIASMDAIDLKKERTGDLAKLFVSHSGLYFLGIQEIGNLFDLRPQRVKRLIKAKRLGLTNQGQVVPLLAGTNGIYFYGVGIDSLFTEENVYWLSVSSGVWLENPAQLSKLRLEPVSGASFLRKSVAEENLTYFPQIYNAPSDDFWLWKGLYAFSSYDGNESSSFPINVLYPVAGDATLKVTLKGVLANFDQQAAVAVNGTEVSGDIIWGGSDTKVTELTFDASLLHDGENEITVTALLDNGPTYFYVDRFELSYPSLYRTDDDSLEFAGDGNSIVTVAGFNTSKITVFDVTDPTYPLIMPVHIIESEDGTYSATMIPTTPERRYHAIGELAAIAKAYPPAQSDLRNAWGADYLIIAPSELLEAAQDLASLRETSGLSTLIVDLEDIIDEFNYGIYSPAAIKDFLTYAVNSWTNPPEYVVLAGSASIDYKDYLGNADNLMPTMVAATPYGLFGSDNYYADLSGDDGIPEIAIGRIPARTSAELTAYINKIKAREAFIGGQWSEQVLMLADDTDKAGDFSSSSNEVSALLPYLYPVTDIYLPVAVDDPPAIDQVINSINNGVGFVNYFGHASFNNLAKGSLMTSDIVNDLNNSPMLPIMNFMTCSAGWFELSGFRSLAEELTLDADGSAAAVWSASGLSTNNMATTLDVEYFKSAFQQEAPTIGKAILEAKAAFGEKRYMLDIYNLMGDPALPIQ